MELIIGTKSWSTWSLRPWLAIKRTGQPFTETLVRLRWDGVAEEIAAHTTSGKVPVLKDGGLTVWDSLAICEYLADRFPEARLWPADAAKRALARSAAAEMHSSYGSLRGECPMNLALESSPDLSEATGKDITRIVALWNELRGRYDADGPYLVGEWSIADAFFTPVASRFHSYGVKLSDYGDAGATGAYAATLLAEPDFLEWRAAALADPVANG
ncbi:glutathione S-transferase family protein [soil metagenome]